MGQLESPGIWEKIQKSVQETERLMGQKKYNLSMIKARQTLEYMVKLQCDKASIVESSMDTMVRELFNNGYISKSTAEHYLQIYSIGNKATTENDNSAYNANQAYHMLSQEVYAFVDADASAKQRRSSATRSKQKKIKNQPLAKELLSSELSKFLIPIGLVIFLIILITILTPKKDSNQETTAPVVTAETLETEPVETEAEVEETISASYKTTTTLNVRSGPSTESDRIGKLDPGKNVEFLRDYDDFWAVILYNGQEAYVAKEYLILAE